jgi:hypothetical protein
MTIPSSDLTGIGEPVFLGIYVQGADSPVTWTALANRLLHTRPYPSNFSDYSPSATPLVNGWNKVQFGTTADYRIGGIFGVRLWVDDAITGQQLAATSTIRVLGRSDVKIGGVHATSGQQPIVWGYVGSGQEVDAVMVYFRAENEKEFRLIGRAKPRANNIWSLASPELESGILYAEVSGTYHVKATSEKFTASPSDFTESYFPDLDMPLIDNF